ncbi:MAG: hypothetical protein IT442_16665 [Phycisphaeraceae bacterium]|nr:hypothetical protein [Phycisphaeraceae bacterium]
MSLIFDWTSPDPLSQGSVLAEPATTANTKTTDGGWQDVLTAFGKSLAGIVSSVGTATATAMSTKITGTGSERSQIDTATPTTPTQASFLGNMSNSTLIMLGLGGLAIYLLARRR